MKMGFFRAERRGRTPWIEYENENEHEDEASMPMAKAIFGAWHLDGRTPRIGAGTSWRLVSG